MRRNRWLKALALVVVIAGVVGVDLVGTGRDANSVAPELPARVLVPPKVNVDSLRGEATAINFWASWCAPCREEAPELQRLAGSLPERTRLVGVSFTDDVTGARSFVRYYGWTFPNLLDPDGSAGSSYRVRGLPTTVILDPRGRIAKVLYGPQTESSLRDALESARS